MRGLILMPEIQRVIRGRGSLRKIMDLAAKLEIRHPMIVGGSTLTSRLLRKVPDLISAPVFSGYHPNPELSDAEAGAEMYRANGCDGIISIGGGSAIDTAKAVHTLLFCGDMEAATAGNLPEKMQLSHIAVPGTAGSGAEATQNAVVYVNGKKTSLSHPDLRPDGVLLDAELLESLPEYHKKSCAMDALAQGIESYWCEASNDDSRVHAYLAILGVLDNLKAYLAGDLHAADEMLDASYQSGKAIQITRTTAAHAMSYQLTKTFGIAHGHAVMLTLPTLWEMMTEDEEAAPILKEISRMMRLGDPLMVPRLLRGIMADIGLEIPAFPDNQTLDMLTDSVNPQRLANHPVKLSRNEIRNTYVKSLLPMEGAELQACLDIWKYYGAQ